MEFSAKQYYLILSETSPDRAEELNKRIVRDNDSDILDRINKAKEFEEALSEVDYFLESNKIVDWV